MGQGVKSSGLFGFLGGKTAVSGPPAQPAPTARLARPEARSAPRSTETQKISTALLPVKRQAAGDAGTPPASPAESRAVSPIRRASPWHEPDAEEMEVIAEWRGPVLSAPGAQSGLVLSEEGRRKCALLANGMFLVDKSDPVNSEIWQAREQIKALGLGIKVVLIVELPVIRRLYEAEARRSGTGPIATGRSRISALPELTEMQREVLQMLSQAKQIGATDIHITIDQHEALVRMRINGALRRIGVRAADWMRQFIAAAFNMASDSDQSQDSYRFQPARITRDKTVGLPDGILSVRLQFNPAANSGLYLVMRLLPDNAAGGGKKVDIDRLGYGGVHMEQLEWLRRQANGIVLVSGPTGSGKSTTLMIMVGATIDERHGEIAGITIEAPPEYPIPQAVQLSVIATTAEDKARKFEEAIISVLRDDPDLIMVGEIRDPTETGLAFAAALTGHLVMSTVHANDSASIITRLRDNKVEPYKLEDHTLVRGLIAQRLVRQLCPHCSVPLAGNEQKIQPAFYRRLCIAMPRPEERSHIRIANKMGCSDQKCDHGYIGRTAVVEMVLPDGEYMAHMAASRKDHAHRYWIERLDGMSMLEHGVYKMMRGEVDPHDIADKTGDLTVFAPGRLPEVIDLVERTDWKRETQQAA